MLRTILTTYLARFASMISLFLLLPIVLGAFGADAYGLYALVVSLAALFQQDLGMGNATTRFIAVALEHGDTGRANRVTAASWAFALVTGALLSAGLAVISLAVISTMSGLPGDLEEAAMPLVILAASNLLAIVLTGVHRQVLTGAGRLDDVNWILIGQAVLRIALTLGVVWLDLGIVAVAMADLATSLIAGVLTIAIRRVRVPQIKFTLGSFRWTMFREMFAVSSQLLVISLAGTLIMQAGSVLTAILLPVSYVAFYAAAQRLYQLVKEVTNSLSVAILPGASKAFAQRGAAANGRVYLLGTRLANMLMTIVLVPVLAFLPLIVTLWLGEESAETVAAATILILSLFANNNHLLALPILTAEGSVKGYAVLHTIWALSGTVAAYILGMQWGIAGIAMGIAAPIALLEPVYVVIALRRQSLRGRDFLVQCLLSPFGTVLVPAAALFVLGRALELGLAPALIATAVWCVVAIALYAFVGMDRALRRSLIARLPWGRD